MSLRRQLASGRAPVGVAFLAAGSILVAAAAAEAMPAVAHLRFSPLASAGDGGSGTYAVSGTSIDFILRNSGTTSWQYFSLLGPPGTTFVGGATAGEITAHCTAGQPDGLPNEIECGPLSLVPGGQVLFVATMSAPVVCGATFGLDVSSAGAATGAKAADVTPSGSCAAAPPKDVAQSPKVLKRPALRGVRVVGHALVSTKPSWSATPSRVVYQWQLCTTAGCRAIAGATGRTLRLGKREAGHTVRMAATATFSGVRLTSVSLRVAVRAKR